MNPVAIPIDYDRWPDYRRFERALAEHAPAGTENLWASHIYMRLWVQLGYYFQTSLYANGCMPISDYEFWFSTLRLNIDPEWLRSLLLSNKIIRIEGDLYFCRPFFLANGDLKVAFRDKQLEMYEAKDFYHRQQRAKDKAKHDTESFPIEFYEDVDGKKVEAVEMNQVVAFIRMLDSVLGYRERRRDQFGLALIHDACRLVRRYGPEKLELVLRRLFKKRGSDGIPKLSEQICSNFDELLVRIEPEVGWIDWAKIAK